MYGVGATLVPQSIIFLSTQSLPLIGKMVITVYNSMLNVTEKLIMALQMFFFIGNISLCK